MLSNEADSGRSTQVCHFQNKYGAFEAASYMDHCMFSCHEEKMEDKNEKAIMTEDQTHMLESMHKAGCITFLYLVDGQYSLVRSSIFDVGAWDFF